MNKNLNAMNQISNNISKKTKIICSIILIIWLVIGSMASYFIDPKGNGLLNINVFVIFTMLILFNLFLLYKFLDSFFIYVKSQEKNNSAVNILLFGFLKILYLIFFLYILFTKIHIIPLPGLIISFGTMIIVPLLFGLVWSYNELKQKGEY